MGTELPGLFTAEELLSASFDVDDLAENVEGQKRTKVRASSIASCARQAAYDLAGVAKTNTGRDDHGHKGRSDGRFTAELGRVAEGPTIAAIAALPGSIHVVDRQVCIGHECPVAEGDPPRQVVEPDFWTTGHPDGALCGCTDGLHSIADRRLARGADGVTRVDPAGLIYGFEHKLYGRYAYRRIITDGFTVEKPDAVQQITAYGIALGWDAVCAATLSQDASSIRGEYTEAVRKKWKWPAAADARGWNPKVTLTWMDLREYKAMLGPGLRVRAEALVHGVAEYGAPAIQRESDGESNFPCRYCDFKPTCVADGQGIIPIPAPPLGNGW